VVIKLCEENFNVVQYVPDPIGTKIFVTYIRAPPTHQYVRNI